MSGRGTKQLAPAELTQGEFDSSNVFIAYSRKAGRNITVVGPACYDAWLLVEFDTHVFQFCERPPLSIALLPLKERKTRPYDFWVRYSNGRQRGIIVADPRENSALDLLTRSIAATKEPAEVWFTRDLRARLIFLRNLKQLAPFVACEQLDDSALQSRVLEQFGSTPLTWGQVRARCHSAAPSAVDAALAHLIHSGRLSAELAQHAISVDTSLARV